MCISRSHWPSNYGDVNKSNSNGDSKLYTALLVLLVEVHNFLYLCFNDLIFLFIFFSGLFTIGYRRSGDAVCKYMKLEREDP